MNNLSYESYEKLSAAVAQKISGWINDNPGSLICFAAGDTPLLAFNNLIELQKDGVVDLASVYYVGLDEWVGLGLKDIGSCRQVMYANYYGPAKIPEENIKVFDGLQDPAAECERIAKWVRKHNGIGLTLLGVGMNGHVGFNEPGIDIPGICGTVALDKTTLKVGRKYFANGPVPGTGITISLQELKNARKIILMLNGIRKKPILDKLLAGSKMSAMPVAKLLDHPNIDICSDIM